MRWTIERLRLAIITVGVVLLVSILGSILYGRWRMQQLVQDLPAHLGLQIQQTTQDFVLSKTEQGRTVFTLHAARAVAFKTGGRVLLHDVEIDIYNRQDGKADTIAGKDFEYDRDTQVVIAQGEAHIALQPPQSDTPRSAAKDQGAQIIHITTHGMVFSQQSGVATCSGEVDFQFSSSTGQAVGAEYDSRQGRLLLQSHVTLTTLMQDHPAVVHASQATYDRNADQIHLQEPRYSATTPQGKEQGRAGMATVFLRPDGSAESLQALNAVKLVSADGTTVQSAAMQVQLDETNQPRQAHFLGGVELTQDQLTQQTQGSGREAIVSFDSNGHADRIAIDGDVKFQQQMRRANSQLRRTLVSNHLLLYLRQAKTGQAQLQAAVATGSAVLNSQTTTPGHPVETTSLAAQTLKGKFVAGNELQHLDGAGATRMRMVAANGDIDTSTGDRLSIDFVTEPQTRAGPKLLGQPAHGTQRGLIRIPIDAANRGTETETPAQSIRTAIQTGHVVLQQASEKGTAGSGIVAGPQISTTTADRAEYDGADDTLTLVGSPEFRNASMEMTANRFTVQRTTGKTVASGAVETTLRSSSGTAILPGGLLSGAQPSHVVARQAVLLRDTETATFSGRARLWQGGNSVDAPVIELSQKMQTLSAHGEEACVDCVHSTFLASSAAPSGVSTRKSVNTGAVSDRRSSTFRVLSQRLQYSDAERKASFSGRVEILGSDGDVYADHADVFLTPAGVHPTTGAVIQATEKAQKDFPRRNNVSQSAVERIVAIGQVRIVQPGRHGTGSRLVYTASDGHFVLTGDSTSPPEMVDASQGSVTGQVLTFSAQTQAIIVSGTSNDAAMTKTRVQQK